MAAAPPPRPVVLFGAFDRHNFGDLLFPHVAARLLPGRKLLFAGLAERDLRPFGGHRVQALAALRTAPDARGAALLHAGGETLACTAWQAAAMLLPATEAPATIAYLEARPAERRRFVQQTLGLEDAAPYVADPARWPGPVLHLAVGGATLAACPRALQAEVNRKLKGVAAVTVRDRVTQAWLQRCGVAAELLPDPAVMTATLFGRRLRARGGHGEVAVARTAFPQGFIAVQCSAEFGDDATLQALAAQLDDVATTTGLGLVLFRAGAAPWHDDAALLQRLASWLRQPVRTFESLDLWDLCALIAASRGFCGSSLHGRIVAMSFALPRLTLRPPGAAHGKHEAFVATWEVAGLPVTATPDTLATALRRALAADPAALRRQARALMKTFRAGFDRLALRLDD